MENKPLAEFIKLYKEHTLLWDPSHKFYTNKFARNHALDILFEKYKDLDPYADKRKMRKKLENLRTTYRRERNKVLKAKFSGGLYEPTLWYYSLMTFLNEHNENQNETTESEKIVTINDDEEANYDDDDDDDVYEMECTESSSPPPLKRSKPASVFLNESNDDDYVIESTIKTPSEIKIKKAKSVYLEENDNLHQEEPSCSIKNEPSEVYQVNLSTEPDLYSKTISGQLNELRPKQRYIAEKLISDVIFYGRLDKLKTGTSLNLNSDI